MGMTMAGVFICNEDGYSKTEILKLFQSYMINNGYILSNEDDSDVQFEFIFSKTSKKRWFLLHDSDFETDEKKMRDEAVCMAKIFKKNVLTVYIVDSDFVMLELYDKEGQQLDQKTLGRPYWEEIDDVSESEKAFDMSSWLPVMSSKYNTDDLNKVFSKEETFVEDSLGELGKLLEMNLALLFSPAGMQLHFKKADQTVSTDVKWKKAPTFSSVFKRIFNDELIPLGFVKLKGMNQIFMRMIGDEVIQFITYKNRTAFTRGYKGFCVLAGLATVYRPNLDFKKWSSVIFNGCESLVGLYRKAEGVNEDKNIWDQLYCTNYIDDNETSMAEAVNYALGWTKKLVFPLFDEAQDLQSVRACMRRRNFMIIIADERRWLVDNENPNSYWYEDLLDLKSGYEGDFQENIISKEQFEQNVLSFRQRGKIYTHYENYEAYYKEALGFAVSNKEMLDSIKNDSEMFAKAMAECERRKDMNLKLLKNLGVTPHL